MKKIIFLLIVGPFLFSSCQSTKKLVFGDKMTVIVEDSSAISGKPALYYKGEFLDNTNQISSELLSGKTLYSVAGGTSSGYLTEREKEKVFELLSHQKVKITFKAETFDKYSMRLPGGTIYLLEDYEQVFDKKKEKLE